MRKGIVENLLLVWASLITALETCTSVSKTHFESLRTKHLTVTFVIDKSGPKSVSFAFVPKNHQEVPFLVNRCHNCFH